MGSIKDFEAVKEADKKPEGENNKIKKNAQSLAELEKAAGVKKEKPKQPQEEVRRAEPAPQKNTPSKKWPEKQELIRKPKEKVPFDRLAEAPDADRDA